MAAFLSRKWLYHSFILVLSNLEISISSESQLPEVAKNILKKTSNKVFLLEGEMGAGKTTLIKALCKELRCNDLVSSPTFSLVNHYITEETQDIYHFDFYRIENIDEAIDIGFEEYLDRDAFCFIEWGERIRELLPQKYNTVHIVEKGDSRIIKFD